MTDLEAKAHVPACPYNSIMAGEDCDFCYGYREGMEKQRFIIAANKTSKALDDFKEGMKEAAKVADGSGHKDCNHVSCIKARMIAAAIREKTKERK